MNEPTPEKVAEFLHEKLKAAPGLAKPLIALVAVLIREQQKNEELRGTIRELATEVAAIHGKTVKDEESLCRVHVLMLRAAAPPSP